MSPVRKILLTLSTVLVLLVAATLLAPFLFRDQIEARVKTAIASNIDARVDWRELHVGLLRTFPNLSLQLQDLSVTSTGAFDGDTLIAVPRFQMVLDLKSVLGSLRGNQALVVRTIELERPRAMLQVKPDGTANWDITRDRAATQPDSARGINISLKKLEIEDALVTMDNQA